MPLSHMLQNAHEELVNIANECNKLSRQKYTEGDVTRLQERVQNVDKKYHEAVFDDRKDKSNPEDDPYEHPGQAQVADELEQVHSTLQSMLTGMEN
ncbi:uncharacterized protein BYT42DRAFT_614338 [Radiomyces spectabilis]|uniref:uncharacterized protein n=1 Tax=Radiomyces spectabilis TaxID=64574 RepID=UPI00221F418E|nr:uncharacterized protein BYT42DRAFT_614338 [Radiomyces spectabilis]KAI8377675.1 hypothetical protein BYT42DRAFT_614338 [Radiomyces spectabilis]